jgi:hypothetical protein
LAPLASIEKPRTALLALAVALLSTVLGVTGVALILFVRLQPRTTVVVSGPATATGNSDPKAAPATTASTPVAAASATATASVPAKTGSAPTGRPSKSVPSVKPKMSCDPPYTIDKHGRRHFIPECVQ